MVAPRKNPTLALIDELLAEQQRLQTPVARYSALHDTGPALEPVYRDLIPLSAPGPGEQYAFEVDLDACSGCKACVAGCHSLNGLDEAEAWRDVGLLLGGDDRHPFQQTVTSACHHCADPACLNGCPVLAYEKDPITGIVRHLDDQCIGCSYCILKCPYDVPKYSARLGIVRKCDMCHQRLAADEAPACVQACPTHAIRIVTVEVKRTAAGPVADTSHFLAAAPDPARTQPTTRYRSRRPLPENARAADAAAARPQAAHAPLVVMLLLTQWALGLQLAADRGAPAWTEGLGWITAAGGLAASVLHLGRPSRAWRIFLGLRRSWLSREAVVFGAWMTAATAAVFPFAPDELLVVTQLLGLVGVGCSAMIYIDTGRGAWRPGATLVRFFGSVALAATAVLAPAVAGMVLLLKIAAELLTLQGGPRTSRVVAWQVLRRWTGARLCWGFIGALLLLVSDGNASVAACGVVFALVGEALERLLYFRTVDSSKMPGNASP